MLIISNCITIVLLILLLVNYKSLEDKFKDKSRELDSLSSVYSYDLSQLSHDLRTPLNAIMGYISLLINGVHGDISEKQKEDLNRISKSTYKILHLVEDYFSQII